MSVFKNSCRSVPVKSPSKRPKTASGNPSAAKVPPDTKPKTASANSSPRTSSTQQYGDFDSPKKIVLPLSGCFEDEYSALFNTLLESNSLLHREIGMLRKEHKLSMSKLANENRCTQCQQIPSQESWVSGTEIDLEEFRKEKSVTAQKPESSMHSKGMELKVECVSGGEQSEGFDTPEEFPTDAEESSDSNSYRITYISTSSSSVDSGQYISPGQLVVGKMWDNFSVDDFSVEDFSEAFQSEEQDKKWTPKVTVPEPFSMTLREANTPKTKSMLIAEKEQEERDAAEKVMKKFHASPIPAHTFLPLYDLMNAENRQRRERLKKCGEEVLKSSQKPFKFSKRDEDKKEEKSKLLKQMEEQEKKNIRERKKFKAKPVPSNLFDPEAEAEALEKEEYRKIRIRMRAEQLIVQARAPYTMRLEEEKKAKEPNKKTKEKSVKSYTFRPKVTHKIPDYKKAYSKFQQQLCKKKQSKLTTVSEPFFLHTERRKKEKVISESEETMGTRLEVIRSETTTRTRAANPPTTETTRRRHALTKERMAEAVQKDALEEDKASARRFRQKEVQKIVAKRSSALNMMYTGLLEEKKKINMQKMK